MQINPNLNKQLQEAVEILKKGGVIAYPTEAVYGLGCDPFNINAITKLLQIKHRSLKKGFILIAALWEQIEPLLLPIGPAALARVQATWPGPVTWVFPASPEVPLWIRGDRSTIAVRVTDHPVAREICLHFGGPIVSTSANIEGFPPARDERTLQMTFLKKIDSILAGKVGSLLKPTEIRDAVSGEILRSS